MDLCVKVWDNGKSVRTLNIIDDFNREILNVIIDSSSPSTKVISQLKQLIEWRGKPEKLRVDHGPEFIAEKMKDYCRKENIN